MDLYSNSLKNKPVRNLNGRIYIRNLQLPEKSGNCKQNAHLVFQQYAIVEFT